MNDPRPRMTSARPADTASSVANRSYTRTGSSLDSTVTAVPRWIFSVRAAAAASTISGLEMANSWRWCSPTPKKWSPTWSASTACSTVSRIVCASLRRSPSSPVVMSPNVSRPKCTVFISAALPTDQFHAVEWNTRVIDAIPARLS